MKHTLGGIEEDVDVPEAQVTDELERSTDQTERSAEQTELPPEQTELLPELVAHLQNNRSELRQEWTNRITDAHLLSAITPHEVSSEVTSVYDNYVAVLETGSVVELREYARDLS